VKWKIWGSLGDEIALTGVIREWRQEHPEESLELSCRWPEVFKLNPHVGPRVQENGQMVEFPLATNYRLGNFAHAYAKILGMRRIIETRPEIHLTLEEREQFKDIPLRAVAIDTWAGWPRRRWPWEHWVALVELLRKRGRPVVEVGKTVPDCYGGFRRGPLPGTTLSFLDKLSVRETASVLSNCLDFVGSDAGLHHLAAAVETPAVILYSIPFYATAYRTTYPLFDLQADCSGCNETCVKDNACLRSISPEDVLEILDRYAFV
jgi:ADP-heptose:LPS heptosyltransferase